MSAVKITCLTNVSLDDMINGRKDHTAKVFNINTLHFEK